MAVNEIQNSSVFLYHEEIFIVYMNVRYRKSNRLLVHVQMYCIKILTLHTGPLGTELSERIFKNVIRYKKTQILKKIATRKQ